MLFREMGKEHRKLQANGYHAALKACTNSRQDLHALNILKKMEMDNVHPDIETYHYALELLSPNDGETLLKTEILMKKIEDKKKYNCMPTLKTFLILMKRNAESSEHVWNVYKMFKKHMKVESLPKGPLELVDEFYALVSSSMQQGKRSSLLHQIEEEWTKVRRIHGAE